MTSSDHTSPPDHATRITHTQFRQAVEDAHHHGHLTTTERNVLVLRAAGTTWTDTAHALHMTPRTARTHYQRATRKLLHTWTPLAPPDPNQPTNR